MSASVSLTHKALSTSDMRVAQESNRWLKFNQHCSD
jgi:hypothetical protein